MFLEYVLVNSTIDGKGKCKEIIKRSCSVDYWLKIAERDEQEFGDFVSIDFKYSTKNKQVVMTKYTTTNYKGNNKITITLKK